ncbi:hypothetical protein KY290_008932 [Solanum tuberosum]|uniref:OVATE domain-containing protein n=1 Tax=Solanum tuberosum TaxID=4113 RepID=A0ABQ7W9V0_SOLTU|nr:hypothetical protein KY284_016185 [Solanum tuberosum]KAH0691184.1 hypothetical protein KY289_018542 [Solanum tuberosum]KAH0704124.1 hypothetical protein KY285_018402 [Solanum tuberosum]KAH0747211.1 hypothetical protein KY285_008868 [Solanum tuberosum]KAH0777521.1 hypothetical protein KY290_008932 [Solanum tuberosum]
MKLSSLFKSRNKSSFSHLLCRLLHCGNPGTLSFRIENNDNIFNSQKFEAGEKTSSILDVSSLKLSKSNNNTSNKGVESLPFNDSCVVTPMDLMDPHEEETTSIFEVSSSTLPKNTNNSTSSNGLEYLPLNDSCVITQMDSNMDAYGKKTSSILEGSKSNGSSSSNGLKYYLPFNDSCVISQSSSGDPYGNIKKSMERMVEANQGIKSWEEFLEEICTSTKNTPFGFSSSEPPSPYFMSLIEDNADKIIAASTSSVIP